MRETWWLGLVLCAVVAGCGNAGANAMQAGGGSPSSGGANGAGGSASPGTGGLLGGSGAAPAGDDPLPIQPDLTGLVPTSSRWLLVLKSAGGFVSSQLELIDLESGTPHPANPGNVPVAYATLSPDGRSFVFCAANATSDDSLSIVRLGASGFVPAKPIQGFTGTPGVFVFRGWDAGSRFLSAGRDGSASEGWELIDATLGERFWNEALPSSVAQQISPAGYYLALGYALSETESAARLLRITQQGVEPVSLPDGARMPFFSHDGQRAFVPMGAESTKHYYLDLPASTPHELTVAEAGEQARYAGKAGPTADSVILPIEQADRSAWFQVFADGRPRVQLTRAEGTLRVLFYGAERNTYVFDYETSFDLVNVEPFRTQTLPGSNVRSADGYWSAGVIGSSAYHEHEGRVWIARFDAAGALVDTPVSEATEGAAVCNQIPGAVVPPDKLVFRNALGTELGLVDLAASPPQLVGRVQATTPEGKLSCPQWQHDGSALAVTETTAAGLRILLVKWQASATPSAAEMVLESEEDLSIRAFSY